MQPCDTCMYSCREGYCGIGSKPYDNYCGDHEVGDRAPVPKQAPLAWLMQVNPYYWDPRPQVPPWVQRVRQLPLTDQLSGLPYIVRGEEGSLEGSIRCGRLRVRYVLVLPQRTYQSMWVYQRYLVRTDIDIPLRFRYQHHEIHVHHSPGLPVIVVVAYDQTARDPYYVPNSLLRWDIGQYLWWTGWEVDTWRVEAFLQGLVALQAAHLRHEYTVDRTPRGIMIPWEPPSMNMYPTRVVSPGEVYNRLLDQYMRDTTSFASAPQSTVAEYLEHWGHVLRYHSYPEEGRHGRR